MDKPENPPAFARSAATVKQWEGGDQVEVTYEPYEGMSLRDYFAAKALPLVAPRHCDPRALLVSVRPEDCAGLAHAAYELADAMLAERVK